MNHRPIDGREDDDRRHYQQPFDRSDPRTAGGPFRSSADGDDWFTTSLPNHKPPDPSRVPDRHL
jgi:hypothetical protein